VVDLDLAQVRAFVAVVDHGHFGRAAASLTLSQQALSKRVARLEAQLGPLLERRQGGIALTALGERFLPAARQMLEIADCAVAEVRRTPPPPLRVDVWGELHPPAALIRAIAREQPDIVLELSMRRDVVEAIAALQRHDLDLAFGNIANLDRALPPILCAELVTTDPIAVLVNADNALADCDYVTPDDLVQHGIWWPSPGSSQEVRAFAEEYAAAIGAPLTADGSNLGLDVLVERVATDRTIVVPVVATWPVGDRKDLRVVPLRPTPHYPWYVVWRTATAHPSMPRVLRALRARRWRPDDAEQAWFPQRLIDQRADMV
jgi:DNA-binding transcriptional LysR family regulator